MVTVLKATVEVVEYITCQSPREQEYVGDYTTPSLFRRILYFTCVFILNHHSIPKFTRKE